MHASKIHNIEFFPWKWPGMACLFVAIAGIACSLQSFGQSSLNTGRPLWVASREWTEADEDDYSAWVATSVDEHFLEGTSVNADCHGVAMAFRFVYARDHKLPVALTILPTLELFGHFSGRAEWDKLPEDPDWKKDQRFQAALNFVLGHAYTHTLWNDLFPVGIDSKHVRPGTIYLFLYKTGNTGHTQTLKQLCNAGQPGCESASKISTLWGNEPASQIIFPSDLIRASDVPEGVAQWGFLSWRWPRFRHGKWELTPANQMPGYSTVQWSPPLPPNKDPNAYEAKFWDWIFISIGLKPQSQMALLSEDLNQFFQALENRLQITERAQAFCYYKKCAAGSEDENSYSTQLRDSRLRAMSQDIIELATAIGLKSPELQNLIHQYEDFQNSHFGQSADNYARLLEFIFSGLSPWDIATNKNGQLNSLSGDAHVSFAARWGLSSESKSAAALATAHLVMAAYSDRADLSFSALNDCFRNFPLSLDLTCSEEYPPELSTQTQDQLIQSLLPQFLSSLQALNDEVTLQAVHNEFRRIQLYPADWTIPDVVSACQFGIPFVGIDRLCVNADQAIFTNLKDNILKWDGSPLAKPQKRWGLPEIQN